MPPRLNAGWHRAHRMAKNASPEQRIAWHLEHVKFCACRPVPEKLQREIDRRAAK